MSPKKKTKARKPFRERSFSDSAEHSGKAAKPPVKRIGKKMLRVIGGDFKRRSVVYSGDLQTRPMKDSVRENMFNILGKGIKGTVAWDLFAGTGIIAIEAISRGAEQAIAIDISRECSRLIRTSATKMGIEEKLDCLTGDTFRIAPTRLRFQKGERRVVFCCPPYKFWETKQEPLNELLLASMEDAAEGSLIVVETDSKYDQANLPEADWDVRTYGNTRLAFAEI